MLYKNEKHRYYYEQFVVRANVNIGDTERFSLFYLLSMLDETRNNINDLYDFKEGWIKHEGLNAGWQTGGTTKITKLAFNLYNGWHGEDGDNYSPLHLFSVADDNREYLLEAIRLRFR